MENYHGAIQFPATVALPTDNDPLNATTHNAAIEALADRTIYLQNQFTNADVIATNDLYLDADVHQFVMYCYADAMGQPFALHTNAGRTVIQMSNDQASTISVNATLTVRGWTDYNCANFAFSNILAWRSGVEALVPIGALVKTTIAGAIPIWNGAAMQLTLSHDPQGFGIMFVPDSGDSVQVVAHVTMISAGGGPHPRH